MLFNRRLFRLKKLDITVKNNGIQLLNLNLQLDKSVRNPLRINILTLWRPVILLAQGTFLIA